MATERASPVTTEYGSLAKWGSWIAALVGLWVVVSPFVLDGSVAAGTPMMSNVVTGVVILVLSAFAGSTIRSAAETETNSGGECSGWIAGLAGLWILITPFVLSGSIAAGTVKWSNVVVGLVAVVLAAYAGYFLHGE